MIRTADPRTPAQGQRSGLNDKKKTVNASDGIYSSKSYENDEVLIKREKDQSRKKKKKEMTFSRGGKIDGEEDDEEESQLLSDEDSENLDSEQYGLRK